MEEGLAGTCHATVAISLPSCEYPYMDLRTCCRRCMTPRAHRWPWSV